MALSQNTYNEHTRIWSGGKAEPLYHPDRSIGEIIYRTLKVNPNNVLQISETEGTILTNFDVLTRAIRIAQHFKKMAVRTVDIIGIVGVNTTNLMPLAVACFFNCTPFHSVSAGHDERTMSNIFALTKPRLIFCDAQFYGKVELVTKSFKPMIYTIAGRIWGIPSVMDMLEPTKSEITYKPQSLSLGSDQTIAILCSSGTTGHPKATCIANNRMNFNIDFITCDDVVFNASGIDWITGFSLIFLNCFYGFTRIISNQPFNTESFLNIVQKDKVTVAVLPPRQVSAILRFPAVTSEKLSTIRHIAIGGSDIAFTSLKRLQDLAKNAVISFNYGTTETGNVTMNLGLEKLTSTGKLMNGIRARIVAKNGKNLAALEVGELYVDHGYSWKGYFNDLKGTQAARDSEGWFHTGDLGYFDTDHYLFIVGRKKETLMHKGFPFWPTEIEQCIMTLPQVEEVCVVGMYDESCGDKAVALVVKQNKSNLSEQDIKEHVAKVLVSVHKQLNGGVIFVRQLPVNNNEKILRTEAKKLFLEH